MTNHKEPKFYENFLNQEVELEQNLVEDYLAEVEEILLGLEKGLIILSKMGKKPDSVVLENQLRFNDVKKRFLKLL